MIRFAGRDAWGVEIGTGAGDEAASTGRALGSGGDIGDFGVALLTNARHGPSIYPLA